MWVASEWPINKNFRVVRQDNDPEGEILGATLTENGVTKTLTPTKENGKVTTPEDARMAEAVLRQRRELSL